VPDENFKDSQHGKDSAAMRDIDTMRARKAIFEITKIKNKNAEVEECKSQQDPENSCKSDDESLSELSFLSDSSVDSNGNPLGSKQKPGRKNRTIDQIRADCDRRVKEFNVKINKYDKKIIGRLTPGQAKEKAVLQK